jgi:hypothetical protein
VDAGLPSSSLLLMAERLLLLLSVSRPAADCCHGRAAAGLTATALVPHQHRRVAKHGAVSGGSGKEHLWGLGPNSLVAEFARATVGGL